MTRPVWRKLFERSLGFLQRKRYTVPKLKSLSSFDDMFDSINQSINQSGNA